MVPDRGQAAARGVRLVTLDRPGFGDSTLWPAVTLRGFAESDIRQLADHLGLARFGVIGFSAGGPAALAIGVELGDRVSAIGLASAVISEDLVQAPEARNVASRADSSDPAAFEKEVAEYQAFADALEEWLAPEKAPWPDRRVYTELGYHELIVSAYRFGLARGVEGAVWDERAAQGRWSFDLGDVAQPVVIWHGQHDPAISRETADYYATHLPHARLVVWDDEAHMGVFSRWGEVLDTIGPLIPS